MYLQVRRTHLLPSIQECIPVYSWSNESHPPAGRNLRISVSCLLNKHLTFNGLLVLNLAGAHDGTLALLSRFDFVLPEARLTSALLLNEMVLHNQGSGSV